MKNSNRTILLIVIFTAVAAIGVTTKAHAEQNWQPAPILAPDSTPISYATNARNELVAATGTSLDGIKHDLLFRRAQIVRQDKAGHLVQRFFVTKGTFSANGKTMLTLSVSIDLDGSFFIKAVNDQHVELSFDVNLSHYLSDYNVEFARTLIKNGQISYQHATWGGTAPVPTVPVFDFDNVFPGYAQYVAYFVPVLATFNNFYAARASQAFFDLGVSAPASLLDLLGIVTDGFNIKFIDACRRDPLCSRRVSIVVHAIFWGTAAAIGAYTGGLGAGALGVIGGFAAGADASMAVDVFDDCWHGQGICADKFTPPGSDRHDDQTPPTQTRDQTPPDDNQCLPEAPVTNICGGDADQQSNAYEDGGQYSGFGSGTDEGLGGDTCEIVPGARIGGIVPFDICI